MSYLTYVVDTNCNREADSQVIKTVRADVDVACVEAATTNVIDATTNESATISNERSTLLEKKFE